MVVVSAKGITANIPDQSWQKNHRYFFQNLMIKEKVPATADGPHGVDLRVNIFTSNQ
jgi:hypothetical protein